jgi:Family of unknown function (DUF6600)
MKEVGKMITRNQKLFLLAMIFVGLLSASVFAQENYASTPAGGDPPDRVARLSYMSGTVSFQPSGEDQWNQAVPNYPLTEGDRIYTDHDGRAELETGNLAIRLSSSTDLTTTNLSDQLVQIGLAQGTLRVRAYDILSGSSVEIDTPNAALTLLRPGSYRVETYPDNNTTLVTVDSGDLQISGNGLSQTIHSGQFVKLSGTDQVYLDRVSAPGEDDFDQWCGDRDGRYVSSNSRQYTGQYMPGYDDLDQYGQWQSAPDYGEVWYPAGVPAGWVPYRYGRWVWEDPWGWTWVEDEPWGFAPFHYGRWALVGSRWGWIPGPVVVTARPIYAPALVAFVGAPGPNVVWFPLGPRDPFFPWYHHSDVYLRQVNVTNVRVVNIVNVINVRRVENIHYAYQRIAPTAVSGDVFRGGRPVARETVRVDVNTIGRAHIIPHPEVQPEVGAVHGGTPMVHPPVERTRPRIESRAPVYNTRPEVQTRGPVYNGRPEAVQRADQAGTPNRTIERGAPPENGSEAINNRPPVNTGNGPSRDDVRRAPGAQPGGDNVQGGLAENNVRGGPAEGNRGNNSAGGPPTQRRPLVTRTPPPPQNPPFAQRQQGMQQHPGRPLEPQQMENVRRGQPAGQMRDREVPSHQGGSSRSGPPARQENRGQGRQH